MGIFKSYVLQPKNTYDKCKVCALMLRMTKTKSDMDMMIVFYFEEENNILQWFLYLVSLMIVINDFFFRHSGYKTVLSKFLVWYCFTSAICVGHSSSFVWLALPLRLKRYYDVVILYASCMQVRSYARFVVKGYISF